MIMTQLMMMKRIFSKNTDVAAAAAVVAVRQCRNANETSFATASTSSVCNTLYMSR